MTALTLPALLAREPAPVVVVIVGPDGIRRAVPIAASDSTGAALIAAMTGPDDAPAPLYVAVSVKRRETLQ